MKKFIALIMTALTCVALVIPAGATFTQYADKEYLCTSSAGYNFNIDDYYNYMKRYNGMTYTTTSYQYWNTAGIDWNKWEHDAIWQRAYNRAGKVFSGADYSTCFYWSNVKTYKCSYDSNGTMRLSCTCDTGYCGNYWEGITITSAGDVSYSLYVNDGDGGWYTLNAHYYALNNKWTFEESGGYYGDYNNKICTDYNSDTIYDMNNHYIARSELATIACTGEMNNFASESMRECYWHYVPYTCYWQYM